MSSIGEGKHYPIPREQGISPSSFKETFDRMKGKLKALSAAYEEDDYERFKTINKNIFQEFHVTIVEKRDLTPERMAHLFEKGKSLQSIESMAFKALSKEIEKQQVGHFTEDELGKKIESSFKKLSTATDRPKLIKAFIALLEIIASLFSKKKTQDFQAEMQKATLRFDQRGQFFLSLMNNLDLQEVREYTNDMKAYRKELEKLDRNRPDFHSKALQITLIYENKISIILAEALIKKALGLKESFGTQEKYTKRSDKKRVVTLLIADSKRLLKPLAEARKALGTTLVNLEDIETFKKLITALVSQIQAVIGDLKKELPAS